MVENRESLKWQVPVRPPSATKEPLNNTAALLGSELNKERLAALASLARTQKSAPEIGVN